MAMVYLAEDLKHQRKVALKVLKSELAAVVGAERFLAEIKTTAGDVWSAWATPRERSRPLRCRVQERAHGLSLAKTAWRST